MLTAALPSALTRCRSLHAFMITTTGMPFHTCVCICLAAAKANKRPVSTGLSRQDCRTASLGRGRRGGSFIQVAAVGTRWLACMIKTVNA